MVITEIYLKGYIDSPLVEVVCAGTLPKGMSLHLEIGMTTAFIYFRGGRPPAHVLKSCGLEFFRNQ